MLSYHQNFSQDNIFNLTFCGLTNLIFSFMLHILRFILTPLDKIAYFDRAIMFND